MNVDPTRSDCWSLPTDGATYFATKIRKVAAHQVDLWMMGGAYARSAVSVRMRTARMSSACGLVRLWWSRVSTTLVRGRATIETNRLRGTKKTRWKTLIAIQTDIERSGARHLVKSWSLLKHEVPVDCSSKKMISAAGRVRIVDGVAGQSILDGDEVVFRFVSVVNIVIIC